MMMSYNHDGYDKNNCNPITILVSLIDGDSIVAY